MCNDDALISDIIDTLDNCVSNGFGRINLAIDNQNTGQKEIEISNTPSCSLGDTACKIPTLFNDEDN